MRGVERVRVVGVAYSTWSACSTRNARTFLLAGFVSLSAVARVLEASLSVP
jgi:hypothetical protein